MSSHWRKGSGQWPKQGEERNKFFSDAGQQGTHLDPLTLSAADAQDPAKVAPHTRRVGVTAGVCEQANSWLLTEVVKCSRGEKKQGDITVWVQSSVGEAVLKALEKDASVHGDVVGWSAQAVRDAQADRKARQNLKAQSSRVRGGSTQRAMPSLLLSV